MRDGIWRIESAAFQKGLRPAIQLISPRLDRDSSLFDRVTIRSRVVHTGPLVGGVMLSWANTTNQAVPGGTPCPVGAPCEPTAVQFLFWSPEQTCTTDWQEFTVGELRSGPVVQRDGRAFDILWEGELIDFRLDLAPIGIALGQVLCS